MKPLLALLCAVAIGYISYTFVYPPFQAYFGLAKPVAEEPPPAAPPPTVTVSVPKVEEKKPEPAPEPKPEPKPEMAATPPPPPPPPPKPKGEQFVPPVFPPIEEVTKGWTQLPGRVFPCQVKVSSDVEVKSTIGATKIASGATAYALKQDGTDLVVAPSPDSKFQGKVAIDQTDIKDIIWKIYDRYKTTQTEAARAAFDAKLAAAKAPKKAGPAKKLPDDKPHQEKDGTYPLLLESMTAGEVTEVKKDNVKKWGDVKRSHINGEDVWVVSLTFEATTPFGKFEQDALAHVKNSKVVKWLYAGSGEVIP